MDRVFLDANVLVSAAWKPDARLRKLWSLEDVRLLASPHVVEEARRNTPVGEASARRDALLNAVVVLPTEPADFPISGDPQLPAKDRPVLVAAITCHASHLLTGDLTHFSACMGGTFGSVRVMLPGEYLRSRVEG